MRADYQDVFIGYEKGNILMIGASEEWFSLVNCVKISQDSITTENTRNLPLRCMEFSLTRSGTTVQKNLDYKG